MPFFQEVSSCARRSFFHVNLGVRTQIHRRCFAMVCLPCGTQSISASDDRGKSQEMPGLYFNAVHYSLGDLFLLRWDPAELGVVDTPDGIIGTDGSLR